MNEPGLYTQAPKLLEASTCFQILLESPRVFQASRDFQSLPDASWILEASRSFQWFPEDSGEFHWADWSYTMPLSNTPTQADRWKLTNSHALANVNMLRLRQRRRHDVGDVLLRADVVEDDLLACHSLACEMVDDVNVLGPHR